MNYNIYYKGHFVTANLFDISQEKLEKVISAYRNGDSSFTLSGTKHAFSNVSEIKVFTNESNLNAEDLERNLNERNMFTSGIGAWYVSPSRLSMFGVDVTESVIGDNEYGCDQATAVMVQPNDAYISNNRIEELRLIRSKEFDFSKLIRLCEELNSNWINQNYYTVGLILRTIINHVPPIFGAYQTFEQAISNYGGGSFKKNMKVLNDSLRSIADSYTHQTIRVKEPLPNSHQVDFKQNLDFLLSEIIAVTHV